MATSEIAAGIVAKPFDNTEAMRKLNERAKARGLKIPFPHIEIEDPVTTQLVDSIVQEAIDDVAALLEISPDLANGAISRSLQRIYFKSKA